MSADARNADTRAVAGESPSTAAGSPRALLERIRLLEAELGRARVVEAHARALVDSERRFRQIVETTAEGVWTFDAESFTTFCNGAMAGMLGYTPEQMIGRHALEFVSDENRDAAVVQIERRKQGVPEIFEFPLRHQDGHEVWASLSTSSILDEQGRYQGALAMVTDASEKRRAERERTELSERMLESQKMDSLGVLAGGIAHDFNNLLAAIMGHVELASQDPALALRSRTALGNALAAAQRAAGLTRQLLDYSGRAALEPRPVRLGKQISEIANLLRASIPKRVAIEVQLGEPALSIMGDPDRLQQACMNLLLNAADAYGGQAGVVYVTVGAEHVAGESLPGLRSPDRVQAGEYVYLEVRDCGSGIDEATLKRVFEPFFTTKSGGHGLGLAATLGIVRAHGGHVTVQSKPLVGTTFRAYFPRSQEAEDSIAPEPEVARDAGSRSRTLLVVDDEPMVREFAQRLLEADGYAVLEAASGAEALTLLRARLDDIDAVLLDLSMPGMDGDALLSSLRSFAPTLPVIVHSGHSLESTSERLSQWNIAGVLQKPYRAARLSAMFRGLFGDPPSALE